MRDAVRMDFIEVDQQWQVVITDADGRSTPGEPFPAFGGDNFSKLEQILFRLRSMGYRATGSAPTISNLRRYSLPVEPLPPTDQPD